LPNRRYDLGHLASLPAIELVDCPVDRFLPAELLRLAPIVHRLRPDLFHSPFFLRPYPLLAPCVQTIHDLHPLQLPKQFSTIERIIFRIGMHFAIRNAAAILTISELSANALRQRWPAAGCRIFVTPLAPDPIFRRLSAQEKQKEAHRLGLDQCRYVFHISSGMRHKNIELLLSAWKQCMQRGSYEIRKLVLAGDYGRRHTQILALARQLDIADSICIMGSVDNRTLVALYNCADLFVFPSSVEGFGLPAVEAMACGTPVLTTESVGAASESGQAAWTIPADALDPLVAALDNLLADEEIRQKLSAAGLARAQRYSWQVAAQSTWQIYRRFSGTPEKS
jgi:glycosyltransferase involved in cell wall biosynthesis